MDAPLIEFHDVDVCLDGQRVLTNITWALRPGENWALIGGNGAGKSTFLKLVRGELAPAPGKGKRLYRFGYTQRTAVGIKELAPLVSPEAQDRYLQLEWKRQVDEVVFSGFAGGDYLYGRPGAKQRTMAHGLAQCFGVAGLFKRDIQSLSTGELRRALIVRALVSHPPLLLLDEVCDGLDVRTRQRLLLALNDVARRGVTQLVFASHRPEEFLPALNKTLALRNGRIVRAAGKPAPVASRVLNKPRQRMRAPSGRSSPIIRIDRASVFLDRKPVLREVTWELGSDENWAVLGANGAGKSTFLKLITGDVHPAVGGSVKRFNLTARNTLWEIRKRIGFLSPALQASYRADLTGAEAIGSGLFSSVGLMNRLTKAQKNRVALLLRMFDATELGAKAIARMSYGELRKILLLRALVHEPKVLVCDEPFDGLDQSAKAAFCKALDAIARNGTRLVTVTHHLRELPQSITHALVLEKGRIVCEGELATVRQHRAARSFFES